VPLTATLNYAACQTVQTECHVSCTPACHAGSGQYSSAYTQDACVVIVDAEFISRLQGMLGKDPVEVAQFLTKTSGLEKSVIGEYLGEREDMALKVMHAYVDAMDFTGLDFDAAIRCEHVRQHGPASLTCLPCLLAAVTVMCSSECVSQQQRHRQRQQQQPDPFPQQYWVLQALSGRLPPAGRGAEDRPPDGEVCGALCALQPRHLQVGRCGIRARLLRNHAQHRRAQPWREEQDVEGGTSCIVGQACLMSECMP
jgi:Sec7 domain